MSTAHDRQSELVARGAASYWRQSRRPLAGLIFVAPLLIIYEAGVLLAGPQALRNGADVWLRQLLDLLGLSHYLFLPALTAVILLAWHHTTREPWRVSPSVLCGMAIESGLLALALVVLARFGGTLLSAPPAESPGLFERLVLYLGAGIYEELLFRLVLLSLVAAALSAYGVTRPKSFAAAVVVTSLLFSAAHYVGPHGESIALGSFVFRALAGGFFSLLFVLRGFGIVVGAHAGYDLIVGLS